MILFAIKGIYIKYKTYISPSQTEQPTKFSVQFHTPPQGPDTLQ